MAENKRRRIRSSLQVFSKQVLSAYALAPRSPVLTSLMLRTCYAIPGTGVRNAISGTDYELSCYARS